MEVYHASTVVVDSPDTTHSRDFLDFGPGFYVTTLQDQAVKYGARFINRGKNAILNIYELADDLSKWEVITFNQYDEAWLDFVTECRQGRVVGNYDVIIGGIANDKVFRTIDLYFAGDISKEECLRKLVFEKPNNQICIRSQQVLNECLTFKNSKRL
ncbi:MAG: DUF3990 domain-containing protein [Candidatus Aphodosoma sp.]